MADLRWFVETQPQDLAFDMWRSYMEPEYALREYSLEFIREYSKIKFVVAGPDPWRTPTWFAYVGYRYGRQDERSKISVWETPQTDLLDTCPTCGRA